MKTLTSHIILKNLEFHAFHGVMPQETKVGNTFTINLKLKVDYTKAGETDLVEDTVSYADVFKTVKQEMDIPSKLLEHVIYRIAKALLNQFTQIEQVEINLEKINPPMGADIETAGVHLICER